MICSPSDITPALLDEADTIDHLMFVVEYRDNVEEACALLRARKFLYSVCFDGQEEFREEMLYEDQNFFQKTLHEILQELT